MLKKLFGYDPAQHNLRTEIFAGITTFLTMAYDDGGRGCYYRRCLFGHIDHYDIRGEYRRHSGGRTYRTKSL